jgi:hypothetical protein
MESKMMDALWRARNRGGIMSREAFMAAAFCNDVDGGPLDINAISVRLIHIRQKLAACGFTVTKSTASPWLGYKIVRSETKKARPSARDSRAE